MNILIELLHLVAAAALSLIGFGYEREEECNPVHFQPAAYVEAGEAGASAAEAPLYKIDDCETAGRTVRIPAL